MDPKDVVKGTFWVAGKLLQGTAYVASECVKQATGLDLYGTVKEAIDSSAEKKEFDEIASDAVEKNSAGVADKRKELEKKHADIHDSWNNDVYVHFFYEDGMLNEKITCTDGDVKKINYKNTDDFDVIIRK